VNRRSFLAAAGAGLSSLEAATAAFPVIDTHIHLFDTTRPGGVPWPPKTNAVLYKPALPPRYRKLAMPHGVVGAIEVEASPLLEDNQWVLDVCRKDTIMLGTVGDLEPDKPDFRANLDRFHKDPLFLGIRYGNLWGRDFQAAVAKPEFIAGIKDLAAAGLTLDTANPRPALIPILLRLTEKVPDLRVVIDHLPQLNPPEEAAARREYDANLRELASTRPRVFVKLSEVLRRVDGKVIEDGAFYKPRLDELFGLFGEDRVVFGSDWPNSDNWAPYDKVFRVVYEYFIAKGKPVAEKYFWKNSVAAYRWKPRHRSQPRG